MSFGGVGFYRHRFSQQCDRLGKLVDSENEMSRIEPPAPTQTATEEFLAYNSEYGRVLRWGAPKMGGVPPCFPLSQPERNPRHRTFIGGITPQNR